MRLAVGIDLGTTHTVVAWAPIDGSAAPEIFEVPQLVTASEVAARPLFPSCLYAPSSSESPADPFGDAPWILGEHAKRRGAEVPGRMVASAKSWLCHAGVDRMAPILPWARAESAEEKELDFERISPVDASARVLAHVKRAWELEHPDAPLADQDVVLTVPASFDEAARELTIVACERAGLKVRLLEEPSAAFYDFMIATRDQALKDALVLVCDVGGGTTDLSLIRVKDGEVERVAVGRHLLLGGDNMDLALAYACEPRLVSPPDRLDAARFGQLVMACRAAKEKLLAANGPDEATVTVLRAGSQLVGRTLSTKISRTEAESIVLEGFFPILPRGQKPERARAGLLAFGLPFERDVAITRHVGHFLDRHLEGGALPNALLVNGGVFNASRITERLGKAIEAWAGAPVAQLAHTDPDLAVARGAVAYALALRGRGVRIGGGAAHAYYVGLEGTSDGARQAVCVVPRGAREGEVCIASGRPLSLVVGRPVRFDLFASETASRDKPGDIVALDDDRFSQLPPAIASFTARDAKGDVQVELEGELSAVGTLDLACVEIAGEKRRWRLAFQLREGATDGPRSSVAPPMSEARRDLAAARDAIDRVFGKGRGDVATREVKDLLRELERLLGVRTDWSISIARALFDEIAARAKGRKRSADHERLFWLLAGFCIRPGFGDVRDSERAGLLSPLFAERLAFPDETRSWQQFWIAWRRASGGLDEATQTLIRDTVDPLIAPAEKRLKKPKGWKLEAEGDLLDMVSSLERVPALRRSELGGFILERTWTSRDPRLWAALGRIGARVPAYASLHHVVGAMTAERWIDHLLREKWQDLPSAPRAAVELARVTGDRARDVSERVRKEVERRLVAVGASEEWVRCVREYVPVAEAERAAFFGESLPVGLRLVSS